VIILHAMPRIGWGLLGPSPFCVKLEVVLRMRGEAYELRPSISTSSAPQRKLPWIEQAGRRLADSELIARRLEEHRDVLEEAAVAPDVRARTQLVRRTVEESLYFVLVAERWRDQAIRARYVPELFGDLPRLTRPLVGEVGRRMLERQLWQQGYGRHDLDTLCDFARDDLAAIAAALGDVPFFTGERPRAVDASVFGLLANLWHVPVGGKLRRALGAHANLVAFIERMRTRYAADVPAVVPS
jgi:glutathione S-transferase